MRSLALFAILSMTTGCNPSPKAATQPEITSDLSPAPDVLNSEAIGEYLCTVAEKASIESIHLEGSASPAAVIYKGPPTRFKIAISQGDNQNLELAELPYAGPSRDAIEWHTENSVLHSRYSGNGKTFTSADDGTEAFFDLGPTVHTNADGDLAFYHSGFEFPGGEDTNLSIRWGRCKKL